MPRVSYDENITTCDHAIVQAARVSYGAGTKKVSEDKGLISYLMRHNHSTPFEMIEMKFYMSMPIFVARQFIRHRTASVNESSARYSVVPDKAYMPDPSNVRMQSQTNKQASEDHVREKDAQWFLDRLRNVTEDAYEAYEAALEAGIGREQARMILPVNFYTEWYWKCDLKNILHLLALRCDSHAQQEIRVYGDAILELIKPLAPWTIEAWERYHPLRNGMLLTALEVEAIRMGSQDIATENTREKQEWESKAKMLYT